MIKKIITVIAIVFIHTNAFAAHDAIKQMQRNIHLGEITMPVSTANETARAHFLLGIKFLHAFMYQMAIDQFQQAQKLDPGFAMSYWGEAMAYKHPIWSFEDVDAARAVLERYKQNKDQRKLTAKEQAYLYAVNVYFAEQTLPQRDMAYANAMQSFYNQFPEDPNVGAFYALALLGLAADTANQAGSEAIVEQGRAVITDLYQQHPLHPGIVHYFIHFHDVMDKELAKKALPATKTALKEMRSSSHIAHMAAHIYRRLEMWQPFIAANLQSVKAADAMCKLLYGKVDHTCNADNKYHSLEWLHYGYLKTGQVDKARETLRQMHAVYRKDKSLPYQQWYTRMWARQVLAEKNWQAKPLALKQMSANNKNLYWSAYSECSALLANGILAIHQHRSFTPIKKRLEQVIALTNDISEPYIMQTCAASRLELLRTFASLHHDRKTQAALTHQRDEVLAERQSTEVTPSLDYMRASI